MLQYRMNAQPKKTPRCPNPKPNHATGQLAGRRCCAVAAAETMRESRLSGRLIED
jgi:hypothetical protein